VRRLVGLITKYEPKSGNFKLGEGGLDRKKKRRKEKTTNYSE